MQNYNHERYAADCRRMAQFLMSLFATAINSRSSARSASASLVKPPCLSAFLFPLGAPESLAPPCMRHRLFPPTAGALHGVPRRVRAPHRGLASIGPVFLL